MQVDSDKKWKIASLTLSGVAVVLLAILLVFAIITNSFSPMVKETKNRAGAVTGFENADFDNGILASVAYLAGHNEFGERSVVDCFTYTCNASSIDKLNNGFENHLTELWNSENPPYNFYAGDFDNDDEAEYLFAIGNCVEWAKKIGDADVLNIINKSSDVLSGSSRTIFVYCDVYNNIAVYQFFVTSNVSYNVSLCLWDCDRLNIETEYGSAGFFVCSAEKSISCDYDDLSYRLEDYFFRNGYGYTYHTDAKLKADGNMLAVFVYGSDGSNYNAAVCALRFGRAIPVYLITPKDNKALFLLNNDDYDYLVAYRNWQVGGKYCYEYQKFDFNSDYSINAVDESYVLENDASNANKVTAFFERFRDTISDAEICADPYQLTGYVTTLDNYENNSGSSSEINSGVSSKYLYIDNCITSKSGIVTIKQEPDNWLNLRIGPNVSYERIAVAGDYVMQACGSVVTVIDTVNTNDAENPIWVRIRINYAGETVVGYSSQRYIRLDGIRHIKTGEQFTVTAQTNDSGLYWKVNDSAVATVDSSTGKLTGIKKGLVMVTVTSASGYSDSCLVAID